jgi:hypothetical protein
MSKKEEIKILFLEKNLIMYIKIKKGYKTVIRIYMSDAKLI